MEEWRAIPGYEGLYEASDAGRIRTVEGKTTSSARFKTRVWKQRILKQNVNPRSSCKHKKNDMMIDLWKDGCRKHVSVARLVAITWCNGYKDGLTVNHKDGNPENNAASNLEWISQGDNSRHAFETGLVTSQKPCSLKNEKGDVLQFRSMSEASRSIGRNCGYVRLCIVKGRKIRAINGEVYGVI